ncbi:ABC transporter ATP-binding protein [Bauldia litoralis]|uniref:Glutathione import ATP-binding protein GsiA n=1 Tax=Bauldia litoralis TaxID=665467 RepID=A0A1G6E760_9HYPH|nr:ABC transporter ATP-binding protein [Bauldia litoralis]SDB53297.1 peptide/nickel transport system ATP-binding protein [Bauldia litoralis]
MTEKSQPADDPVLSVRDLTTEVATPEGRRVVVDRLSFDLAAGETLCIAGESGSGKSMTALSIMRLLPEPMARIASGSIHLAGRDLAALSGREMRRVRGADIAMIFQEPMTSLNPVLSIGHQLTEAIRVHRPMPRGEARALAVKALSAVRIGQPERRLQQYPHELSGGMRQRVMIAMAIAGRPRVLIADEPTTALDVTVQAQILELIRTLQKDFGTAVILITHDMGVVAEMADRVIVMNGGAMVEAGPARQIFHAPAEDYTRMLLAAVPRLGASQTVSDLAPPPASSVPDDTVVKVSDLTVRFDIVGGILRRPVQRVHAVEGISFDVRRGETVALVGESGCGKSTTGKALLNLVPWDGAIVIDGAATAGLGRSAMKPIRRSIQMIFQDPYASLDPRMTVGELVAEPLTIHGLASGSELTDRVAWLFNRVGLSPDQMQRHPHEFSGGQRQRVCIARALSLSPKIIVADESVSALDVSVQARVLALLQELQDELGLSYLFISHDMAVVEQVSHRVAVMYLGQIVEMGSRAQVFGDPRHAYTRRLLEAVLVPDPDRRHGAFPIADSEVPSPIHPVGQAPARLAMTDIGNGHFVAG